MARFGQRPENALKRANEFIEVGKPARALDTLYEVFRNKKWAYNWSESVLEPIMFKYLDLCVELKKSHIAKEGLFQYRNMFQSVNVGSLENVIRGYLRTAEERTESAREQSQQAVIDIDDLDNLATPESILLSAVSGEDAQDRSDRTILTPWVKFLWESYCQCLELLRTNAHVETLYHDIARMAYQFCLKYSRKTEFRKLCDKLRKHLEDIAKLPPQTVNVSLNKPETQQFNLDTRLLQLDSAIQMELWQEAYKATEDIHGLMNMSKKPPVPKTMANYYQKLAMVFWKAGYYLFHAAALFKLFQLSKDMKKNITPEELQRMACRVLLATLSIPLPSAHPEFDRFIETDKSPLEKAQRLAVLLTLSQPPTRASLLKDIVRVNVVNLASPSLQELYNALEVEFNPLTLCARVQAVTDGLQGVRDEQYIPPLQDVTLVRLVRQVSQVYQTIKFSRLLELAPFTNEFHLERLLVDCVRHNDMQIRIDHANGSVHFGTDLSESQREDKPEGPTLQSMPSEQVRSQLINMSTVLTKAMQVINPNANKGDREKMRLNLVNHYHETKAREHQRILARHKIIEDRKEYLERLNTVREEEEARRAEELARQQALAEQRRLEHEREERERKRHENEIQQIKDRHLKEKMHQISQTSHGQKVLKRLDEEEIKKLDAEQIAAREAEELLKERREIQQKLKSQEKKVDYFERAKRIEEIPLLQQSFKDKQVQDRQFWEAQENERIAQVVKTRELAVQHRERLARMVADKNAFLNTLKNERNSVYQEKLKEFENQLSEERKKRLRERRSQRKEERRHIWEKEREEEERRKKEEEQKRKEEEERLRKEEKEKLEALKRAEEEEMYRKKKEEADRQALIQRQREEEAQRKFEEREKPAAAVTATSSSWRRGGGGGGELPEERPRPRDRDDVKPDPWRRGGAAPASDGKAAEPWRPSRGLRDTADRDKGGESVVWRRGPDRDREEEKEKGGEERDERDGARGADRYERGSTRATLDRERDTGRTFEERASFRGTDRGGTFDRERVEGGRGGDRFERGGGVGVKEKAFERRDDKRIGDMGGGGGGGGSWRSRPSEAEAREDEYRTPARRGVEDRRAVEEKRSDERSEWRTSKDAAPPPRDGDQPEPVQPAAPEPTQPQPAEDGDDGNWQKVSRR